MVVVAGSRSGSVRAASPQDVGLDSAGQVLFTDGGPLDAEPGLLLLNPETRVITRVAGNGERTQGVNSLGDGGNALLATLSDRVRAFETTSAAVEIRMDADEPDAPHAWTPSTVARELRFLASHTTHHFAIMRVLLADAGVRVPAGFGLAPATQRHREQLLGKDT